MAYIANKNNLRSLSPFIGNGLIQDTYVFYLHWTDKKCLPTAWVTLKIPSNFMSYQSHALWPLWWKIVVDWEMNYLFYILLISIILIGTAMRYDMFWDILYAPKTISPTFSTIIRIYRIEKVNMYSKDNQICHLHTSFIYI